MHGRKVLCMLLLVGLAAGLVSCRGTDFTAAERLSDLLARLPSVPAGVMYDSGVTVFDAAAPLSAELVAALYARADGFCEYAACVREAAVYLGAVGEPYLEMAVFLCYGSADTVAVAEMCLRRARLVASLGLVREEDACVTTVGRTVYFYLSSTPDEIDFLK